LPEADDWRSCAGTRFVSSSTQDAPSDCVEAGGVFDVISCLEAGGDRLELSKAPFVKVSMPVFVAQIQIIAQPFPIFAMTLGINRFTSKPVVEFVYKPYVLI